MSHLGVTLIVSAGALLVLMVASWLLSLRLRDVSIVDVVWGLGFVIVAWLAFSLGHGDGARRWLVAAMTTIWGLRLAIYIGRRKLREPGEDFRYTDLRERTGERFALISLASVFLLQGALIWVVSLPVSAAAVCDRTLRVLDYVGVALWAVGVFFEGVGDAQLARFKSDPANRSKVMDRGLWRYTRHPNYFGDFCVWWGFYAVALASGAWWSIVSPLTMCALLLRVSGKDRLEKALKSRRPGYEEYMARTSGFFPLPPRRRR